MITIIQAARYLIHLSYVDGYSPISPLKLQKLLYLAQGWSFVWDDKPLFVDCFEAWQFGPVNREVYGLFQKYGRDIIPKEEGKATISDTDSIDTLDAIWKAYNTYSAYELVNITHSQEPWISAYADNRIISTDSIRSFFRSMYC